MIILGAVVAPRVLHLLCFLGIISKGNKIKLIPIH